MLYLKNLPSIVKNINGSKAQNNVRFLCAQFLKLLQFSCNYYTVCFLFFFQMGYILLYVVCMCKFKASLANGQSTFRRFLSRFVLCYLTGLVLYLYLPLILAFF